MSPTWPIGLLVVKPETVLRWHRGAGVLIGPGDQIGSTGGALDSGFPKDFRATRGAQTVSEVCEGYLRTLTEQVP
jgi:hypothetical protein